MFYVKRSLENVSRETFMKDRLAQELSVCQVELENVSYIEYDGQHIRKQNNCLHDIRYSCTLPPDSCTQPEVYVKTTDILNMQIETYKRRIRNFSNIVQKYVNKTKNQNAIKQNEWKNLYDSTEIK